MQQKQQQQQEEETRGCVGCVVVVGALVAQQLLTVGVNDAFLPPLMMKLH
jgi:hypothetical protein